MAFSHWTEWDGEGRDNSFDDLVHFEIVEG